MHVKDVTVSVTIPAANELVFTLRGSILKSLSRLIAFDDRYAETASHVIECRDSRYPSNNP